MAEAAVLVWLLTRAPGKQADGVDPRPKEFAKSACELSDDEDDSNVGKMPPSDSEDE